MRIQHFAIMCVSMVIAQTLHARSALEATAQIVGVRRASLGEATVITLRGGRERALVSRYLFPGESVEAKGDTAILVRDCIQSRTLTVTAASGPFRVPGNTGTPTSGAASYVERFATLLTAPRREITVYTTGRGPLRLPQRSPLLASPVQYLPAGLKRIALVWNGGVATARVLGKNGQIRQGSISQTGSDALDIASFPGRIELIGTPIAYEIRALRPPSPPWLDKYPDSKEDRIAAALWLILEGPAQWHLFALSELEAQSHGNATADRLWHAARTGELVPGNR